MIERQTEIVTAAGRMPTFITHPERDGPHPAVLLLMDAGGIREELRTLARRLATAGYYVLLPNLYYRDGADTEFTDEVDTPGSPAQLRVMERYLRLKSASVVEDTSGLLAFIDTDPAARSGPVGCFGFCMSGPFALAVAATHADRFAAAVSIHGTNMVTAEPDSPHRLAARIKAELYIAWAEHDSFAPLTDISQLRTALGEAGTPFELEVHSGTEHGFTFPRRPWFDRAASDKVWERMFALFRRRLG